MYRVGGSGSTPSIFRHSLGEDDFKKRLRRRLAVDFSTERTKVRTMVDLNRVLYPVEDYAKASKLQGIFESKLQGIFKPCFIPG